MNRFPVTLTVIPLLALPFGCTHDQLRRSTSQTQASMSDLRYKHVLDNLAMMVRNPASVPNPVAINGGVVQISDSVTGSGNITWNPPFAPTPTGSFHSYFLGLSGSRTYSEQWSLAPLQNPQKLSLMWYAFQLLLGSDLVQYEDGVRKLRDFLGDEEFATAIPRGWFCVGTKHDVPKNARYCGSYHDVYVWVTDEGVDGLSEFYLTILRIALLEAHQRTAQVTRTYEGAVSGGNLKSTAVQSVEQLPVRDEPTPSMGAGEFPAPGQGLQFVPPGG
jgi:hypothetical protein